MGGLSKPEALLWHQRTSSWPKLAMWSEGADPFEVMGEAAERGPGTCPVSDLLSGSYQAAIKLRQEKHLETYMESELF